MKTMQRDRVKNTINQSSWNPKIYSVNPQESRKRLEVHGSRIAEAWLGEF